MAALPQYIFTDVLYFPLSSLLPLLVLSHYNGTALRNGALDTVFATDMLISSITLGVWGGSWRKMMTVSIGIGVLGLATAITGILPASMFLICLLCTFVMGHTAAWFNVLFNVYVQESTDEKDLGKVITLLFTVCTIANPVGLAISGSVSEAVGIGNWFLLSGVLLMVLGLLCYFRTRKPEQAYIAQKAAEKAVLES